jgi:hypothetical protein
MAKGRLDYHSSFARLMEAAAENKIQITNDINQPGESVLFFHDPKGRGVRRSVELEETGKAVQQILDMRNGILIRQ